MDHKDLVATILQKHVSAKRVETYAALLDGIIGKLSLQGSVSETDLISLAKLDGKIVVGTRTVASKQFSDDAKSQIFIRTALSSAIKCPVCHGYLDAEKSVSYDHVVRAREGGVGHANNGQLTHPYCNQAVKN